MLDFLKARLHKHIVRIISFKIKRKTKLKPLCKKLKFLNVEGVFKPETAKFMLKFNTNKLSYILTKKVVFGVPSAVSVMKSLLHWQPVILLLSH